MTSAGEPPADRLPLPRYGRGSIADLLPSLLAALGVTDEPPALAFPPVRRACVLLVDGLGLDLLRRHPAQAPFLTGLLNGGPVDGLTAVFPSTTSASLTSFGTGLTPGAHGVVGFEMYLPDLGRVLNCLHWDPAVPASTFQPQPTLFERAAAAGVSVSNVGPRRFAGTGLTEAGLRGGVHLGADTVGERVAAAVQGLAAAEPALVYVYEGDLDTTGHRNGCESAAWRHQLAQVDRFAEQLASVLPDDAVLVVTADHGMVDVPRDARRDLAAEPALDDGVRLLAGEPRAVYVHTEAGAAPDVLAAWRESLGEAAWVLSRDEAVAAGLFGPQVRTEVLARIGDVVAIARSDGAVLDSRHTRPAVQSLVGMHGSLTWAELEVPVLVTHRG